MNCWHCNTQLTWGGDDSYEDHGLEGEGIVTNLSCPNCAAAVMVYYPISDAQSGSEDQPPPQSTDTPLKQH